MCSNVFNCTVFHYTAEILKKREIEISCLKPALLSVGIGGVKPVPRIPDLGGIGIRIVGRH